MALLLLVVLTAGAGADIEVVYTSGYPSAVTGVVVGEAVYDVSFVYDSFDDLWGDPADPTWTPPTFWDDQALATEVFDLVDQALNSETTVSGFLMFEGDGKMSGYRVPIGVTDEGLYEFLRGNSTFIPPQYVWYNEYVTYDFSGGGDTRATNWPYAVVSTSVVPLPGAALLGVLGLSYSGWRLRRRSGDSPAS